MEKVAKLFSLIILYNCFWACNPVQKTVVLNYAKQIELSRDTLPNYLQEQRKYWEDKEFKDNKEYIHSQVGLDYKNEELNIFPIPSVYLNPCEKFHRNIMFNLDWENSLTTNKTLVFGKKDLLTVIKIPLYDKYFLESEFHDDAKEDFQDVLIYGVWTGIYEKIDFKNRNKFYFTVPYLQYGYEICEYNIKTKELFIVNAYTGKHKAINYYTQEQYDDALLYMTKENELLQCVPCGKQNIQLTIENRISEPVSLIK